MSRNGSPLGRMLTVIDAPQSSLRFLILDCPTESTLDFYMEEFMRLHVVTVVRCCQPTYSAARLAERNIQVLDLPFKDGGVPPPQVVREWLQLVEKNRQLADEDESEAPTIAVHCVAGLGRAPALVAIALIEMGMKPLDAIEYIRGKRRGAFNKPQIAYLDSYKRTLKPKSSGSNYSLRSSLGRMFKLGGTNNKSNASSASSPPPTSTPQLT
ncbi:protein-tyrosine phosphatase-like protein [Gilbertella persicaria]|uniref:protein-tyrosine phosphatase-like protein n=1 Tax=Gilbertella persicaria TaxID=101096 RepID=UPI00221FFF50|nr:protein-tyrosine phosphatase-like protein [Gilbertella persicaria]KAI8073414.1 protein-tyrosine phosphatase-like protein [Gilbertella persicaria]